MNMHLFLRHIYLLSLGLIAWRQLLEFNSQIVHFMIALPKPDNISLTCHQATTTGDTLIVFTDEKLSRALVHKSMITAVLQQQKNSSWPESHIYLIDA